jgi:hypothetical protein
VNQPLRNSAGKVIGSCDSMPFDILGRRKYQPRARPAPRVRPVVAAADTNVEIDAPRMQDVLRGYGRLK